MMLDVYLAKLKQNRENTEQVKELRVENPELDFEASDYTKKTLGRNADSWATTCVPCWYSVFHPERMALGVRCQMSL